ncbi:MAG TPA: ImmA/IrrE family metallo-endopeptidase [Terriglobia bacterium]|nr:ImmA/IrrE family metallo-endopeptidase [Terriglobia bacterium]
MRRAILAFVLPSALAFFGALASAGVTPASPQSTVPASPSSSQAGRPPANSTSDSASTSTGTKPDSQSVLAAADAILSDMSRITGLAIKAQVKKQIVSRTEVEQYLADNVHSEYTAAEMHAEEASLKAFGLVPADFNLERFLVRFYTEQAAGFYDPRRKTMFIADWVEPEQQKLVLAHELTHALQDQSFDLEKYEFAERGNDDATAARQAVVEGYATAAMMQELMPGMDLASLPEIRPLMEQMVGQQMKQFPVFSQAPFFFRFQALFPYAAGLSFMQKGLQLGGWKKLNLLFAQPPETTREIFQPEAYFEPGSPAATPDTAKPEMTLPHPTALAGLAHFRLVEDNAMGELGYYGLLGQLISEDEAKRVAPQWRADRYLVYENPDSRTYLLVARTRWASADMALDFFRDYRTLLGKKYPDLTPSPHATSNEFTGATASGQVIVLRRGDEVVWAECVPASQTEAMLDFLRSL